MRNERPEISRAVGQPTADRPLGGRQAPELAQKKSKTGRNLAVAGVILAVAGAGGAAFLASRNGEGNNPNPSQPGGIVEPSNTPIPTGVNPSESIVIPSATPEATPTPTPTPEVTPVPQPLSVDTIIEGKHGSVAASKITGDINKAFDGKTEPIGDNEYSLKGAQELWNMCQKGDPSAGGDPVQAKYDMCRDLVFQSFIAYKGTVDNNFYNLSKDAYNYTLSKFPQFKSDLNSYLKQTLQ